MVSPCCCVDARFCFSPAVLALLATMTASINVYVQRAQAICAMRASLMGYCRACLVLRRYHKLLLLENGAQVDKQTTIHKTKLIASTPSNSNANRQVTFWLCFHEHKQALFAESKSIYTFFTTTNLMNPTGEEN